MTIVRLIATGAAVLYWLFCLALHLIAAFGGTAHFPSWYFLVAFFFNMGFTVAVLWALKPRGEVPKTPAPPRQGFAVLTVASLMVGLWPMVVGDGVPGTGLTFGDSGVASGDFGDRYVNNHGRRVRNLTEEEYQQANAWNVVIQTAFMAGFAGMLLAGVLTFRQSASGSNSRVEAVGEDHDA